MVSPQVRGGRSVKIRMQAVNKQLKAKYACPRCGKPKLKRTDTGIWKCKSCSAIFAGGAYSPTTQAGEVATRVVADYNKRSA
jgi:large subunit ribosomal protein L37Ae